YPPTTTLKQIEGDDLYAIDNGSIYVTHDEQTWRLDTNGMVNSAVSVALDSSLNVYIATAGGGIRRQAPASTLWIPLPASPSYASHLFVSSADDLYAETSNGPMISRDRGTTWSYDTAGIGRTGNVTSFFGDRK